jgi:NAD-dependent dihydropyrimidine dehydrogenase PreA subunit
LVVKTRKIFLEQFLAHAPDAPVLQDLAQEYGAHKDRFEKEPSFCILCGLCVRYCAEVKKKNAIGFGDKGVTREISFIPELASFNFGSMNFAIFLLADRYQKFKYSWEPQYLSMTEDVIFSNTFKTLREFCQHSQENEVKPELEIYDVSMVNNAAYMIEAGLPSICDGDFGRNSCNYGKFGVSLQDGARDHWRVYLYPNQANIE